MIKQKALISVRFMCEEHATSLAASAHALGVEVKEFPLTLEGKRGDYCQQKDCPLPADMKVHLYD